MIHPDTELRMVSPDIGLGLFATRRIPRGTLTWVRDPLDQVISAADWKSLPPMLQAGLERHTWQDASGDTVLCWDLARFVNHACVPNCLNIAVGVEIAVRDIEAGEELTNDYANLGMYDHERLQCQCGLPGCRGLIAPNDAGRLRRQWTSAIAGVWAEVRRVEQPLWKLLSDQVRETLMQPQAPC